MYKNENLNRNTKYGDYHAVNIYHTDVTEVNDRVLPDFIIYAGATNLKKTHEYKNWSVYL